MAFSDCFEMFCKNICSLAQIWVKSLIYCDHMLWLEWSLLLCSLALIYCVHFLWLKSFIVFICSDLSEVHYLWDISLTYYSCCVCSCLLVCLALRENILCHQMLFSCIPLCEFLFLQLHQLDCSGTVSLLHELDRPLLTNLLTLFTSVNWFIILNDETSSWLCWKIWTAIVIVLMPDFD